MGESKMRDELKRTTFKMSRELEYLDEKELNN